MLHKILISLIFFIGIAANADEVIEKPFEVTNVVAKFVFYETLASLTSQWNLMNPDDPEDPNSDEPLQGFSYCEIDPETNISFCDIYTVRPTVVDGEHTLTIGHEIVHGIYGDEYHE